MRRAEARSLPLGPRCCPSPSLQRVFVLSISHRRRGGAVQRPVSCKGDGSSSPNHESKVSKLSVNYQVSPPVSKKSNRVESISILRAPPLILISKKSGFSAVSVVSMDGFPRTQLVTASTNAAEKKHRQSCPRFVSLPVTNGRTQKHSV